MKQQYLIRLDDACPTMDSSNWGRMESILDKYGVRPMVGVIPYNEDPKQLIESEDKNFWNKVRAWKGKGWTMALHGYNHCYTSSGGMKGLNPMWSRSEFAGLPLSDQREKIRKGFAIMKENNIIPEFFFAPSHTFDDNTLEALRLESPIRLISDTIGRYPYRYNNFTIIPQISGHCIKMPFSGIYTFCFHPNTMKSASFESLDSFLNQYCEQFICFNEINQSIYGDKRFFDKMLSWAFFSYRKIRGIQ